MTYSEVARTTVLLLCSSFILANGEISISNNQTGNYLQVIYKCKVMDEVLPLNCSILLEVNNIRYSRSGCLELPKNQLTVILDQTSKLRLFECISENPFSMNFDFGKEKPRVQFSKFQNERISPVFFDPSTYKYKITMIIPENQRYEVDDRQTAWFQYEMFDLQRPNVNVRIRFSILSSIAYDLPNALATRYRAEFVNGTYKSFLPIETRIIHVTECIVVIPCLAVEKMSLYYFHENDTQPIVKVDEGAHRMSFNSLEGFRVNISDFPLRPQKFICTVNDVGTNLTACVQTANCLAFDLQYQPKTEATPLQTTLFLSSSQNYTANSISLPKNTRLRCSSTENNVTIVLRYTYKDEILISPKYYEETKLEHRYYAEVEISYLLFKTVKGKKNQWGTLVDDFDWGCVLSDSNTTQYHQWFILRSARKLQLYYNKTIEQFVCVGGYALNFVPLLQLDCDQINECKMWEESLENQNVKQCSNNKFVPFLKGTPCKPKKGEFCISTRPLLKGIIQCSQRESSNDVGPVNEIYFQGYDSQIYTEWDSPLDAILALETSNNEEYVLVGQTVRFECKGHSFFHAHGIQWLISYNNGIVSNPPAEMIHHEDVPESRDIYNPLSIVSITFPDKEVSSVICAVPILNATGWHKKSTSILTLNPVAPKISSFEFSKTIKKGEAGQSLSCTAEGRPTPIVNWSRRNNKIEKPLYVVNQGVSKLLLFPEYNDTYSGEYICTASNSAGKSTATFIVSTENENVKMYYIVGAVLLTIIALTLLGTYMYIKTIKMKRYEEIKGIIKLLKGDVLKDIANGSGISEVDPVALPYKEELELEKDSISLDKRQILGMGEFGVVYTGLLEGIPGSVAVKTVHPHSPFSQIKALVSELKILAYVGGNESIVRLYGAYTQEIQQGIIYVVTELCDLGCLLKYLQKNRHLFLKCPQLKHINENDYENIDKGRNLVNHISLHSARSLLKWSAQIANGMAYLEYKKVIHSDLAARNVLLNADADAKITDFGLSRRMYDYSEYVKKTKDPLPWRWLALESITTNTFSTFSDIWSYGITLWEIFSLGEVPYQGSHFSIKFVENLKNGFRNSKPNFSSQEIYEIMKSCWCNEPSSRPSFAHLASLFMDAATRNTLNVNLQILKLPSSELVKDINALHYCQVDDI